MTSFQTTIYRDSKSVNIPEKGERVCMKKKTIIRSAVTISIIVVVLTLISFFTKGVFTGKLYRVDNYQSNTLYGNHEEYPLSHERITLPSPNF